MPETRPAKGHGAGKTSGSLCASVRGQQDAAAAAEIGTIRGHLDAIFRIRKIPARRSCALRSYGSGGPLMAVPPKSTKRSWDRVFVLLRAELSNVPRLRFFPLRGPLTLRGQKYSVSHRYR